MGISNARKVTGSLWGGVVSPTQRKMSLADSLPEGDGHPDLCSQVESVDLTLTFSNVDYPISGPPSFSESCLPDGNLFLQLGLHPVNYDTQHNLADMRNEIYCAVV